MDHRVSKDMISSGMSYSGNQSKEDLGRTQYGSVARPDVLMNAYQSMYSQDTDQLNEGVRDLDPEKGTKERKARLEKKRGMNLDDHPQYKKEEEVKEAKVDKKLPDYKRSAARTERYGNPYGSVGSGPQRDRRADHEARRGVKKEEFDQLDEITASRSVAAPSKPTKKLSPMDQFAKANPKLAAAAAERARIRGTAQSDNPLLDELGLRSGMRAGSPTVQSPTLKKDLGNLAPNYTRLTQNPNAGISPTPKPTTTYGGAIGVKPVPGGTSVAGAVKPVSGAPSQDAKVSVAPAPKPSAISQRVAGYKAGGPPMGARERMLNQDLDLFDIIKGHLLDEGYADTEQAALVIMTNMSEEWKQSIVEMALTPEQESRRRDLSKAINKAGTPGYPGVDDPATRKMQGEYIQLQKLKGV